MDDLQIGLAVQPPVGPPDQILHIVGEAPELHRFEREQTIGLGQRLFSAAVVIVFVPAGEIHPRAAVDDGCVQKFRKLNQQRRPFFRAPVSVRVDDGVFRGHQHLCSLAQGFVVALRMRPPPQFRNAQLRFFVFFQRVFLNVGVDRHQHRTHRCGGGEIVGLDQRFPGRLQACRLRVPFGEIAHRRVLIQRRVIPFDVRAPRGIVLHIARNDQDRRAVGIGVVHRHRGVLQADGAVHHGRHRFARNLGIAMRHCDGAFLVQAHDEFGLGVHAVIEQRFLQAPEGRCRQAGDVIDAERLDDIHHEIRTAARLGQRRPVGEHILVGRNGRDAGDPRALRLRRRLGRAAASPTAGPAASAPARNWRRFILGGLDMGGPP